jgi:hypothetical protein
MRDGPDCECGICLNCNPGLQGAAAQRDTGGRMLKGLFLLIVGGVGCYAVLQRPGLNLVEAYCCGWVAAEGAWRIFAAYIRETP